MVAANDAESDGEPLAQAGITRGFAAALDTLPRLTRAVFLLSCRDELSYADIGWRCGISVDEVMLRMADALAGIRRDFHGKSAMTGRLRRGLAPWRATWMRWQIERRHRRAGIPPSAHD